MLELLLEYQTTEGQLLKISKELKTSEAYKQYDDSAKYLTAATAKVESMDKRAENLANQLKLLEGLESEYADLIKDFENIDELVASGADFAFYKKNATGLADKIKALKTDIKKLEYEIKSLLDEYTQLMKNAKEINVKYKQLKDTVSKEKLSREEEVKSIKARLDELEGKIRPDALERYKSKRKEKLFPVIVEANGNRCPCGVEFSMAEISKLEGDSFIECENCHRIVFKRS